ncbi:hypothetical protein BH20ACT6_BH20ACT6_03120 [soil metagenome]
MATDRPGDDGFDAAWAQIVAGYDRQVDEADRVGLNEGRRDTDDPTDEAHEAGDRPGAGEDGSDVGTTVRYRAVPGDDGGHFVPPTPPPLPRPRGASGLAWIGVLGGPLVLVLTAAAHLSLPTLVTAACVLGFVGGMVFLIVQLDDGDRDGSDGWDDGAQV